MLQLFLLKTSSLFNFIFYCKCRFYIYDSWLLHYLLVLFSICYACDNPCIWKLPCEWIIFFSREILFQMLLFCQRFLPCRVLTARSCTRAAEWDIPRGCHRASLSLSLAHAAPCVTQIRAWADTRGVGGFLHGIPNTGRFNTHRDTQRHSSLRTSCSQTKLLLWRLCHYLILSCKYCQ